MRAFVSTVLFVFLLPLSSGHLSARQSPSDIRLRLAQSYEKSGDFEAAIRVYDELFSADSSDFALIEALKRCHLRLKQHDEVIALIEHGLRLNPRDIGSLAQLGNVWLMKGDEGKADEAWRKAIELQPADETTYRVVGSSMMQVRQFERAVATYTSARSSLGKPGAFASDIAYLYAMMQRYRDATTEYLTLLRQTPSQLGYIQSRISSFTGSDSGLTEATRVVAAAVSSEEKNLELRRLLAWLSMEARDYDSAFETYRQIDRLAGSDGKELFTFAERALAEKSFAAASRAYAEVLSVAPNFRDRQRVRLGLARSGEELAAVAPPGDTSVQSRYAAVAATYERIVLDHPSTDAAAQSLYRLAMIRRDRFGDPEGARRYLETIGRDYKIFLPTAVEAKITLAEVYIELDELDRAATVLGEVAGPPPFGGAEREKAALRLAELKFYRGDQKGAMAILTDLMNNAVSDAANDAIPLQMLIAEHAKEHPAGLKTYASAQLLRAQRKNAEALAILDEALRADTADALRDRYASMKGEILSAMKRPDEAIAAYAIVIDGMPGSLLRDRAMFAAAAIHETARNDRASAIGMYERLLEKYPASIHANAARKRIRELRGDNI